MGLLSAFSILYQSLEDYYNVVATSTTPTRTEERLLFIGPSNWEIGLFRSNNSKRWNKME